MQNIKRQFLCHSHDMMKPAAAAAQSRPQPASKPQLTQPAITSCSALCAPWQQWMERPCPWLPPAPQQEQHRAACRPHPQAAVHPQQGAFWLLLEPRSLSAGCPALI